MKTKQFLLTSIFVCVLASCTSSIPSEEYMKMNLKGHIKTIKESRYDVDYINKEVVNKRNRHYTTYEFDKKGYLLCEILYDLDCENEFMREQYELSHDTLYKRKYYSGKLQDELECKIIDSKGLIRSSFNLNNRKVSSLRTYEYNRQNKTAKITNWDNDGFISSIEKFIYDKNGYLERIVSCNEDGDSLWTVYSYMNDENGRHLKTRLQLNPNGYPRFFTKRYNEFGDITYDGADWWEWKYKYTYDNHNNWITQLRKGENNKYQYTEREYIYY